MFADLMLIYYISTLITRIDPRKKGISVRSATKIVNVSKSNLHRLAVRAITSGCT